MRTAWSLYIVAIVIGACIIIVNWFMNFNEGYFDAKLPELLAYNLFVVLMHN